TGTLGNASSRSTATRPRAVADDFVVPATGWSVTSITGFAFMDPTPPGFPPASPITTIEVKLFNTMPVSGPPTGLIATRTAMIDNTWTGIYRTPFGNPSDTTRPIMAVTVDFGNLVLTPGTYWATFMYSPNVSVYSPFVMGVDGSGAPVQVSPSN